MMGSEVDLGCYSSTWQEATAKFRQAVEKCGGEIHSRLLTDNTGKAYTDEDGTELTVDFAVWSTCASGSDAEKIFLYTAGIHGVEGYTGSAILLQTLKQKNIFESLPANAKVIMAHVLNPYGMAHLRRVNERNVDLNRNWLNEEQFETRARNTNALYKQYSSFINPVSVTTCEKPEFYGKLALILARHGYNDLKQALAGGQSEFPEGVFFGGIEKESGTLLVLQTLMELGLDKENKSLKNVIHVDIHTGLGPWNHDTLLTDAFLLDGVKAVIGPEPNGGEWHYDLLGASLYKQEDADRNGEVVNEEKRAAAKDGTAYEAGGNVIEGVFKEFRGVGVNWTALVQEFGTYSGLETVRILRKENAHHHHRGLTKTSPERQEIKELFCPEDEDWRTFTLERGLVVFGKLYDAFIAA